MGQLADIPIRTEPTARAAAQFGNALPILNEIRHALARFVETRHPTTIDLASIPFGPGDEARLMALLGRGEVQATIEALGPTHIWETRFSGVWVVDYAKPDGERVALQIEIDEVPRMLRAQGADLVDSLAILNAEVGPAADNEHAENIRR
jgi:hydrogenase-1 operon protein HyaF